jgi:hypothetical protein
MSKTDAICPDVLGDLGRYKVQPEDGAVVGWVEHKKPKEREMEFRVKLRSLKAKPAASGAEQQGEQTVSRDEL